MNFKEFIEESVKEAMEKENKIFFHKKNIKLFREIQKKAKF